MSAEEPRKARGGKFARRNFKRKEKRAALDSGLTPEEYQQQQSSAHQAKKQRTGGAAEWARKETFLAEVPRNPKFESYYLEQGICPPEEWAAFLEALRTKLPTTFRLSTINGMHNHLLHQLQHELQVTPEQNKEGLPTSYTYTDNMSKKTYTVDPPQPLPWYPHSLGWYIKTGKSELKAKGNMFEKFRAFLMAQNDQGNLNRQEAVSMIPPLLLDVQPHHMVLDMCAAPGSKTAQLLEGLHGGVSTSDTFITPTGMVVANDADAKRAYMLVHQLKRYGSSAFLVTTHDGQHFPNIYRNLLEGEQPDEKKEGEEEEEKKEETAAATTDASTPAPVDIPTKLVQFDRILCDVPCSGDGTLRKNINLWSMWDTKFANGLHSLQVIIACRALEMLKVGGLMVYSTCSFNPVENESVVLELCRRAGGKLEIVDVSQMLPGLIRQPGLTQWKVRDTFEDRWASPDEEAIKNSTHKILRPSMFPPTAEEIEKYQPQRCMRVLPHSQDTGGFFIALLRKTGELSGLKNPMKGAAGLVTAAASAAASSSTAAAATPTASPSASTEEDAAAESVLAELPDLDGEGLPAGLDDPVGSKGHRAATKNKEDKKKFKEDPFEPMNAEAVKKIIDFYGLEQGVDHSNFFTRSDSNRKCYFVVPAIARLLNCNRNASKLKIVHTGSRCYEKGTKAEDATFPCQYRVVQEGVESILPFMTKQLFYPTFEQCMGLLWRHAWPYKEMDKEGVDKPLYREVIKHKNGCVIFVLKGSEINKHVTAYAGVSDGAPPARRSIPLCVWKTPHSLSLMISGVEQNSLLKLLDPEEKFMPESVRIKREEKKKAEQEKIEERKRKMAEEQQGKEGVAAAAASSSTPAVESSPSPSPIPSPSDIVESPEATKMEETA